MARYRGLASGCCVLVLLCFNPAVTRAATDDDEWAFGAALYGWLPDISGTTTFAGAPGGGDFTIGIDQILDNLQFTVMGSFDARRGRVGFVTDR